MNSKARRVRPKVRRPLGMEWGTLEVVDINSFFPPSTSTLLEEVYKTGRLATKVGFGLLVPMPTEYVLFIATGHANQQL